MMCSRVPAIAMIILAVVIPGYPATAQEMQGYGIKIYRVESGLFPLVNVYFRTFNQNMDPLANLNYVNIGLMVKGKAYDPKKGQYAVQPLRQRPEAVRTVLVLDASGSMCGKAFEATREAAARYIDQKRLQDQIAILAIRDTPEGYELISTWERSQGGGELNRGTLGRRLLDIKCDGKKSRIFDTIGAALQMAGIVAQESLTPREKAYDYTVSSAIVVFSDGHDEGSALSREELNTRITNLHTPIPIYSIAYTNSPKTTYFNNLEALSKNSFGKYYPVGQKLENMQKIVEDIHNILLNDYVLTFRTYLPPDGEEHTFKLGVEYPSGSGKYLYETAKFEAIETPPLPSIEEEQKKLGLLVPPRDDKDPYLKPETPGSAAAPKTP